MLLKLLALASKLQTSVNSTGISLPLKLSLVSLQTTVSIMVYVGFQNYFQFLKTLCFLLLLHPIVVLARD